MPRPEKVQAVEEIKEQIEGAGAVLVTEYRGLKVKDLRELRQRLAGANARYKVYKNTLVRFAARDLHYGELEQFLEGPTALAFCESDPIAPAKVLSEYARTNPNLLLKASVLQGKVFDTERTKALADLESREVLMAKAAGLVATTMSQVVSVVQALVSRTAILANLYQAKLAEEEKG
jgi:large subunit ribosomal protein L10